MDLSVVISAFSLLFLAEMGDKSQLLALTLAHRYRVAPVIAGTFAAFALLNLLAVFVGQALFEWSPQESMLLAAAGLFLYLGYRSRRDADDGEDEESDGVPARGALVTSFIMSFAAELGDKTQLAMIALVAGTGEIWSVFVGATLALWAVSLIGILFGATLLRKIPSVSARIDWTRICVIKRPPGGVLPDGLPGEFESPVSPDASGHCSA